MNLFKRLFTIAALFGFLIQPYSINQLTSAKDLPVVRENFQKTINGKQTDLYVLENSNGMKVAITNYGGRIVSWLAPDRDGNRNH